MAKIIIHKLLTINEFDFCVLHLFDLIFKSSSRERVLGQGYYGICHKMILNFKKMNEDYKAVWNYKLNI